jgi:peptidoglycan/LPS O-acetylase OafA/YrhL
MVDHYMAVDFNTPFPWFLLPHFYVAVDMFMILSGFVLAMSYEGRFNALSPPAAYVSFFKHRIARLFPMYALMTLVCFALCRLGWLTFLKPDASVAALAANLLAVQTWLWPGTSLDGPGWSISAEWAANLVFPILMPAILSGSLRRASIVAGLAVAVLLLSAILFGTLFDVPARGVVNIISGPQALGRCVSEFIMGMYLWLLKSRNARAHIFARDGIQLAIVAVLALLMFYPRLDVVLVMLLGLLILGLAHDTSVLSRLLGSAIPHRLGVVSYSIYILHIALLPLRDVLAPALDHVGLPHSWIAAVTCTAATTLALAFLCCYTVERPAQRWLNRVMANWVDVPTSARPWARRRHWLR